MIWNDGGFGGPGERRGSNVGGGWGGSGGGRDGPGIDWGDLSSRINPGGGFGGPGGCRGSAGGRWANYPGRWDGPGGGNNGSPGSGDTTPTPTPVKKLGAKGGETGAVWDDGHHDNVKKVYVGQGTDGISAVKFEYIKGSQVVFGDEHGKPTRLGYEDFELEAGEYITSVEGTYDKIFGHASAILTMLLFKTNLNKTKGPFGIETQSRFEFKEEGYKITGFHGRAAGDVVHAIGVYLTPIGTTPLKPATPA